MKHIRGCRKNARVRGFSLSVVRMTFGRNHRSLLGGIIADDSSHPIRQGTSFQELLTGATLLLTDGTTSEFAFQVSLMSNKM